MWEYKIYRELNFIHSLMKQVVEAGVDITDPDKDKHELIHYSLEKFDNWGWKDSPNFTKEGNLAYFLAKEFKNLYDYYHDWRRNILGFNMALALTECIRCLEAQKKYGLSRDTDEEIYTDTLNLLRKEYHRRTVLKQDTTGVVNQANSVFKDLRDRVLDLYTTNYPKAVKGLEI